MNKKPLLTTILAFLMFALPIGANVNGQAMDSALKDAKEELCEDYTRRQRMQERMSVNFLHQHEKMLRVIKNCNELSMQLYLQKKEYTLDLSYALRQVTDEYQAFSKNRTPYDRVVADMDLEIDRYARLLETLRRLPPVRDSSSVAVAHDSIRFRNDSLEHYLRRTNSTLEENVRKIAKELSDSMSAPFILSAAGQADRDSCMFYASELLNMFVESKNEIVSDNTHYQEAYIRLKESYDYAVSRYNLLQKEIFLDGQIPYWEIITRPEYYHMVARAALHSQYALEEDAEFNTSSLTGREENTVRVGTILYQLMFVFIYWVIAMLLMWVLFKWVPPLKKYSINKYRRPLYAMIIAILVFIVATIIDGSSSNVHFGLPLQIMGTYFWQLIFIMIALMVRVKPEQLWSSIKPLLPSIFVAFILIAFRVSFMPNIMMNIIFPPVLAIAVLWQVIVCFRTARIEDKTDRTLGWVSLFILGISTTAAIFGYIFISIMIMAWWYFQLSAIYTVAAIDHLLRNYKNNRLNSRIAKFDQRISYVSGADKKAFLFFATWFYDLVRDVIIPVVALLSFPLSVAYALGIFDFDDLFNRFYYTPFFQVLSLDGVETFRFSVKSIIVLVGLFFVFKYLNTAIKSMWQQYKFASFRRKYNRTSVQSNEVNLSLGKSIINVFVWFVYAVVVITELKLPTGSLGLVAGGLSAGIGLAMKDILNNFIYGIQLMSGRLRVGDWIECDGIRGQVTDINYQSTLVETLEQTQVAFLNSTLFGKSFNNLTRNGSYEYTKVIVGVAYGEDIDHVREVLEKSLEVLKTKDKYGREIVDPKYGIYVRVNSFADSAVEIVVKQFVLVPERIAFVDKEKELIYKALNENGITIPFPQRDIHLIK